MSNETDAALAEYTAIRAEIDSFPPDQKAIIELLSKQLRDACERTPLLYAAMSLVAAEAILKDTL